MANDTYTADANGKVFAGRFNYPTWRRALNNLTWSEKSSTKISEINPANNSNINPTFPTGYWNANGSQSQVISSWSGAVWVNDYGLIVFGGGHQDYRGNEIYRLDKDDANFTRPTNPTGAIGNEGELNDGLDSSAVYFDGQPRSFHTYNNFAVRNGVAWCFGGSVYVTGFAASRPFYFDSAANLWVRDADVATGATFGSVCYDSARDRFVILKNGNATISAYDVATKSMVTSSRFTDSGEYNWSCYDEQSDSVIYFTTSANNLRVIPADFSANNVLKNQINKPTFSTGAMIAQRGVCHDKINRVIYVRGDGSDVWKLQIPDNPIADDFTWEQLSVSGSVTSTPQPNGTYGRFFYAEDLKCIGIIDSVTDNPFFLALE